jgi:hypothetical protein
VWELEHGQWAHRLHLDRTEATAPDLRGTIGLVISESTAGGSHSRTGGPAFWYRLVDNLFRRLVWWLLLIFVFTALGFVQAGNASERYQSDATLSATENPLVGSPVVAGASAQWWETPATVTSRIINEQLRTDTFVDAVADSAGLTTAVDSGFVSREAIRGSIRASPAGDGILSINATWADPQTSYALVLATIDEYQGYIAESVASNAAEAEEFYSLQLGAALEDRAAAERALQEFITTFVGDGSETDQPVSIQIEIDRLRTRIDAIETKVSAAQTSIEEARLQVAQQTTRAGRSFSVIDEPSVPSEPMSTLRDRITTIGSFFVLGLVVAGAGLLITTVLDRSISSAADLIAFDEVTLVATVPTISIPFAPPSRRRPRTKRRVEVAA